MRPGNESIFSLELSGGKFSPARVYRSKIADLPPLPRPVPNENVQFPALTMLSLLTCP